MLLIPSFQHEIFGARNVTCSFSGATLRVGDRLENHLCHVGKLSLFMQDFLIFLQRPRFQETSQR
jgi:hypothetical protein